MAEGRDDRGRFLKGHKLTPQNGGGRPSKAERADLKATIDANVSAEAVAEAWHRIEAAMLAGGRGWQDCFELYLAYRYGKPAQYVDVTSGGQGLVAAQVIITLPDNGRGDTAHRPATGPADAVSTDAS